MPGQHSESLGEVLSRAGRQQRLMIACIAMALALILDLRVIETSALPAKRLDQPAEPRIESRRRCVYVNITTRKTVHQK